MKFNRSDRLIAFFVVCMSACLYGMPAALSHTNSQTTVVNDLSAFYAAYDKRDFDTVTSLVNARFDASMRAHNGGTMLAYAAANAEDEVFALRVARLLLSKGAPVNDEDSFGRVPVIYAIEEDRKRMAALLLDNGAGVTLLSSAYKMPIVFVPFLHQNAALAYMVISKCPDVNIRDSLANTPLSWASRFGYLDSVKLLLEKGAQVDNVSIHNKTPLMEAAERGHKDVAVLLVQKGANIDIQTKKGWSALMWAAEKGYNEIVSLLIEGKADLFVKNNNEERALTIAQRNNHQDTAEIIEEAEFLYWLKKIMIFGALACVFIIVAVFIIKIKRREWFTTPL